jgi:hypothetical protein
LFLGFVLAWPRFGWALTDEAIFREFRFSSIVSGVPGVEPPGMGGASVALDGNVSAVQSNPAGLHFVTDLQVFGEFRAVDQDDRLSGSSRGSLDVDTTTGERDLPYLGLTSASEPETYSGLNFLGVAGSFDAGPTRVAVAGSRQVLFSQQHSLTTSAANTAASFSFDSFPNTVSGNEIQAYSVDTIVDGVGEMDIVYWNVGASVDVGSDFSLGATLTYATLDLATDTATTVEDPAELFVDPSHPRLPATPTTDVYETRIDHSDSSFAWSVGIDWHPGSVFPDGRSPWRFGVVYRKGASFTVEESTFLNQTDLVTFDTKVTVPDRYGLGVTYNTERHWTFTAELEHVQFSDLLDGFQSGVNYLTSERLADGAFATDPDTPVKYAVDAQNLPRLGVQYLHFFSNPGKRLAIRGGYYRAPDATFRMTQFNSTDPDVNDTYLNAFGEGEDRDFFTAGVGYRFGRSSLQLAGQFASEETQVALSYLFDFGGKR